jgi:hypothetical protein
VNGATTNERIERKGAEMTASALKASRSRMAAACGALVATILLMLTLGAAGASAIEIKSFQAGLSDYTATGHPDSIVEFKFATGFSTNPPAPPCPFTGGQCEVVSGGAPKDIIVDLPQGTAGNPRNILQCTTAQLTVNACPQASQVGIAWLDLVVGGAAGVVTERFPIFNMAPIRGDVSLLGIRIIAINSFIAVRVRPDDYGLETASESLFTGLPLSGAKVTIWGVPLSPANDPNRVCVGGGGFGCNDLPIPGRNLTPYFTAPAQCAVDAVNEIRVNTYQEPDHYETARSAQTPVSGCNEVEFNPSVESKPTTNLADAPTGLDFHIHMPQNEAWDGRGTAPMRDAVVTLPEGMTVNPPSAAGLGACSMAEVGISPAGISDGKQPNCPDASKIGTATATSPALANPAHGAVYLAKQNDNPFGSLLALYLVLEEPEQGILVKTAGEVKADPVTGRLTTSFKENPQLPVEDIELHLKQGPRAPLKTPPTCGTFETATTLTPWTAPEGADATPPSSFELVKGPGGGACPGAGAGAANSPSFSAGTVDPTAAAYTPFVLKLARADGTQPLKAIDTTLPKGLLGKLAGIPYCSDSALAAAGQRSGRDEQASASCPAASQLGTVDVGAGAGSQPLYVGGKAYLAGPYKGAPLSLAILTPAVAGPFDLGTVVVRTALQVNPETAQIRAVSDPIPTILRGIPLDLRSIALRMDRPGFVLNPTSCNPMAVSGQAISVFDQSASLSNPFQVGECGELGFKPKLALRLKGGTKRSRYPALTATLTYPKGAGSANIARTVVALPHSEFLAQNHIRTVCTRVQFAADQCPAGSIYGTATAVTPLLDKPLEGPVYLRSSSNKLPDMVVALHGQIDVDLVGRIDSVKGGIRTSFESVPDAPVSSFTLRMQGGKKGLLENSRDLCNSVNKASVEMDGQNGKTADQSPVLVADCRKKHKKGKKAHRKAAKHKGKKG